MGTLELLAALLGSPTIIQGVGRYNQDSPYLLLQSLKDSMVSKLVSFLLLAAMSALLVVGIDWMLPSKAQVMCNVAQVQSQDECDAAQAFVTATNKTSNPPATTTVDYVVVARSAPNDKSLCYCRLREC